MAIQLRWLAMIGALSCVSAAPTRAAASEKSGSDAPAPEDDDADENDAPRALSHRGQFGLRLGFLFGYKMAFRYERSPLCQEFKPAQRVDDQQKVCGFGASPAMEVALSFAPFGAVEPYLFTRLGLAGESSTDTRALKMFGAGARLYTMHDAPLKLFVEPAVGVALEGSAGDPRWSPATLNPSYKTDFVFHLGIGPEYDFARYVGVFANAGVDIGILRALTASLTAHVGVQVRYP